MLLISVLVFSCVASIVISSIVGIQKGDISIFLSLLCSFFSIILSVVALWYTSKSGLAMDEQFDTLKKMIRDLRALQHEVDTTLNDLTQMQGSLTPELQKRIEDFRADLSSDDFPIV